MFPLDFECHEVLKTWFNIRILHCKIWSILVFVLFGYEVRDKMSTGHQSLNLSKKWAIKAGPGKYQPFFKPLTMREVRYNSWNSPSTRLLVVLHTPLIEYPSALQSPSLDSWAQAQSFEKFKKRPLKKLVKVQFEVCFCIFYSQSRCILGRLFSCLTFHIASEVCFHAQCKIFLVFVRFHFQIPLKLAWKCHKMIILFQYRWVL